MKKQTAVIVHHITLIDANATTKKTSLVKQMEKIQTFSYAMVKHVNYLIDSAYPHSNRNM